MCNTTGSSNLCATFRQEKTHYLVDSVGITNAKKALEWQHVADAVIAAAQTGKNKWSHIKVEATRCIASQRVCATGGGKGTWDLQE